MTTLPNFDDLSIGELRKRRSAKWTMFPADVLPAWVAEMDFPLDDGVRNALLDSIRHDDCGYANGAGVGAAFAAFVQARFDWALDPRGVFVIPDVLVGISEVLRTLTKPGDRIVVNSPVYPPFYRVVGEVERQIEDVPLVRGDDGAWSFDLAGLERAFAGGAAAYLLCSPHNPLGMVFDATTLACIAELAKEHHVLVIADEIHAPLTLPGATFVPFLPIGDLVGCDAVALASASKAWNLPGLKCAVAVAGSERMRKKLALMRPELPWSASNLGVVASIAAFTQGSPWLDALLVYLGGNRKLLAQLLARDLPGVRYIEPQASYLAWLDCSALELGPDPVAAFLERGRVALTRGRDFGPASSAFVRVNMGTSASILTEVVARMKAALA
ncbi:MAG TPA: aminotransferase class I/II-fold pyridoxal phosphate-dependent enzyme [Candidatus Lustribacter sp.]